MVFDRRNPKTDNGKVSLEQLLLQEFGDSTWPFYEGNDPELKQMLYQKEKYSNTIYKNKKRIAFVKEMVDQIKNI